MADQNPETPEVQDTPDRQALRHTAEHQASEELLIESAKILETGGCTDIIIIDVRGLSDVTDYLLIASGTSGRQMKSLGDDIEKYAYTKDYPVLNVDKDNPLTWLLVDFVDVIVHIFEVETRTHYDMEMLWGDAPRIAWK